MEKRRSRKPRRLLRARRPDAVRDERIALTNARAAVLSCGLHGNEPLIRPDDDPVTQDMLLEVFRALWDDDFDDDNNFSDGGEFGDDSDWNDFGDED